MQTKCDENVTRELYCMALKYGKGFKLGLTPAEAVWVFQSYSLLLRLNRQLMSTDNALMLQLVLLVWKVFSHDLWTDYKEEYSRLRICPPSSLQPHSTPTFLPKQRNKNRPCIYVIRPTLKKARGLWKCLLLPGPPWSWGWDLCFPIAKISRSQRTTPGYLTNCKEELLAKITTAVLGTHCCLGLAQVLWKANTSEHTAECKARFSTLILSCEN